MSKRPAAPHAKVKAARRVLSPDEAWAAKIRTRLLADCHPLQRDAATDPARRYSILVGRGGTKTTTFRVRGALKMSGIRRAEILYLALTEDHARELNWDPLQDMNEHYGLELRFNKSELTATCARTGSRYVMGGMENDQYIEQYRGKSRDELQVDETASQDPQRLERLLDRIVGPRLGDRKGCIGLGGTPGHILTGEFYDATRPGSPKHAPYADRHKPDYVPRYWSSHSWSLKQIVELPNAAELYPALVALWEEALLEKAAKGWSDDNPIWMREYLGLWASDLTGRVFQYRPTVHQWDPFAGEKLEGVPGLRLAIAKLAEMGVRDLHYVVPADGGHSDPFAINVLAFSPTDPKRRIWHVMFLERTGWYAKLIAELVAGPESVSRLLAGGPIEPLGGVLGVTGWPDASVMDTDESTLGELKNVYGLNFKKADRERNAKKGKIELVNGEFHEERLYIIKNSPLEDQLGQLQWKEDINGQLKEDPRQANHCLVAGTMIMTEAGEVPIERVRAGDRVWTRVGLRSVLFAGETGLRGVWRMESGTRFLVGTGDHPVWTQDGWKDLALLTPMDTVALWESTDRASSSSSAGRNTDGTPREPTPRWPATSPHPTGNSFTVRSGPRSEASFRPDGTSTTSMATTPITTSPTFKRSTVASTNGNTASNPPDERRLVATCSPTPSQPPQRGIVPTRAEHGIPGMHGDPSQASIPASVSPVVPPSFRSFEPERCAARSAEPASGGAITPATTVGKVLRVIDLRRAERVYDLTIEGAPEFFANGVLVHNSTDTLVYGRDEIAILFESGAVEGQPKADPSAARPPALAPPRPPDPMPGIGTDTEFEGLLTDVNFADVWGNQ